MLRTLVLAAHLLYLNLVSAQTWFPWYSPAVSPSTTLIEIRHTSWKDEYDCGNGCYNEFYLTYDMRQAWGTTDTPQVAPSVTISVRVPASGDVSLLPSSGYEPVKLITAVLMNEYGSWQEVWSGGVCTDVISTTTLKSAVGFSDFNVHENDYISCLNATSLSSIISSSMFRPVCTKSTYIQDVSSTGHPIIMLPSQTSVNIAQTSSADIELSQAAKISIGIAVGTGSGLILFLLAFFVWRRRLGNRILQKNLEDSSLATFENKSRSRIEASTQGNGRTLRRQSAVYWTTPFSILSGLLLGLILEVGHHYMYAAITGQPVDDHPISQSWMFRFGTLLAFLVKVSFGTSVGVAFSQFQWFEIRRKSLNVAEIDTVSHVLDNVLDFVYKIWLLSLLPAVAPGSLNVVSWPHKQNLSLEAPRLNMTDVWYSSANRDFYPLPSFVKILLSTALGGQILFSAPQSPNQSFHLEFLAPAIDCHPANASVTATAAMLGVQFDYLAWTGNDYWMNQPGTYPSHSDMTSENASRLFIAFSGKDSSPPVTIDGEPYEYKNVTECLLYNTSYEAEFIYLNSELSIQVTNISFKNYVPGPGSIESSIYLSIMWGLGSLLVDSRETSEKILTQYTMIDYLPGITKDTVETVVEELFLNMTLSVLASGNSWFTLAQRIFTYLADEHRRNETVMGQVTTYRTTYEYHPFELVSVYALAFLMTLLCSATGLYAFLENDGSYRNSFSTYIRATNQCNFPIEENNSGIEPFPRSLGRTRVDLMPKASGLVVPRSAEEEALIETVPVPPASAHVSSSSPGGIDLIL